MNKKKWFAVLFVMAIIMIAYQLYRSSSKEVPAPVFPKQTARQVIAEARLVPVKTAMLSLPTSGVVSEILTSEGEKVQAGQLLVRLSAGEQAAATMRQAQAELERSKALLGDLKETAETDAFIAEQELQQSESALKIAGNELTRAESLLKQGILTQQKFDEVFDRNEAARADVEVKRTRHKTAASHERIAREQYRNVNRDTPAKRIPSEYHSENIAATVAAIRMAEASLERAWIALRDTELRAPFDGIVGQIIPQAGEYINGGATVLTLADLSSWQIETTDLTELSVVNLKQNDIAKITFDAIPDLEMPGRVTRIQPMGENKHGDILYTVVVKPDRNDARFRWNMTAVVNID